MKKSTTVLREAGQPCALLTMLIGFGCRTYELVNIDR